MAARDASAVHHEAHQLLAHAGFFLLFQAVRVGELLGEFGNPTQAGFQGRRSIIYIVAIQAVAHFEAQGIAGTQADGLDAVGLAGEHDFIPDHRGAFVGNVQLEAARAGVASSRNNDIGRTGESALHERVVRNGAQIHVGKRLQGGLRLRALHGQQAGAVRDVLHLHALRVVLLNPVPVFLDVRRIDYQQVVLIGQLVYQQVVHDAAVVVGQAGILGFAVGELAGVVAGHALDEVERLGAAQAKLAHVRYVEHAHGAAHSVVLVEVGRVAHRHVVAGEGHHFGTQLAVLTIEGNGFQGNGHRRVTEQMSD